MNQRGLMVAVVILAALAGVLYWSQHRKPAQESSILPPSTTILTVNTPQVTQLVIKQKGSEPITLVKSSGKWEITTPKDYAADQEAVAGMLSTLSGLPADRVVETQAADRKPFGLDPPAAELDVVSQGHNPRELLLGDDTPTGGDVYAALAGDPRVFTIASYNKSSLDKGLNDLRNKSLLTVDPDKVSHLELIEKPRTIDFGRTKDGWQILKPAAGPADADAVNDLLRTLTTTQMDLSSPDASDAAAAYAHGAPVLTAKLTGDSGVQTLEVRKDKDNYYAKSSVVDGVYKVQPGISSALDKKLSDFQKKKTAENAAPAPAAK